MPPAIILGWYNVIHGSFAVAKRATERLRLGDVIYSAPFLVVLYAAVENR